MENQKYVVYDNCLSKRAEIYTDVYDSKEEALAEGQKEYDRMTAYDKSRRDAFYVGLFEIDEDGEVGDCIEIIKEWAL